MKRWLPHPWLSVALATSWCLLNVSVHPAHLLLACTLGWLLPFALGDALPAATRLTRPWLLLPLLLRFAVDVVLANLDVARLIMSPRRPLRSAEVWMPMRSTEPLALSLLTLMITMTPGTLATEFSADRRSLRLHILDCEDPATVVAAIRQRYEQPLLAIFGEAP